MPGSMRQLPLFGCFEFIKSFTPVIRRATIRHQENEDDQSPFVSAVVF